MNGWDKKIRFCICQESGCDREYEKKPFTNRKYCDRCQDLVRDAKHRAAKRRRESLPIVNHADGCHCGGCCGIESKIK